VENVIEENGGNRGAAGIRIRGATNGLVFKGNVIRDTRPVTARTQTTGIRIDAKVGPVELDRNQIDAATPVDDRRPAAGHEGPAGGGAGG